MLATWENILIYWKNYNITECLKQFITINTDCLEKDNKIVKSVKSLNINDEISIRLIDGKAKAIVLDIKE